MPVARAPPAPTVEAEVPHGLLEVPTPAPGGAVATSLITTELGVAYPVRVLLRRSLCTESEISPFGVIGQEQHERISSLGLKV